MGWLDWLLPRRRDRVRSEPDLIWLTDQARWQGIVDDVCSRLDDGAHLVVVAHFADALDIAARRLAAEGVPITLWHPPDSTEKSIRELQSRRGNVCLTLADLLPRSAGQPDLVEASALTLIAVERHPLRAMDQTLVDFAHTWPQSARIRYHLSLDDALLQRFAGPQVKELLQRLGLQEDEIVQNHLVGRRIAHAQRRIAACAIGHEPARSAAEWLERNCPQ